MKSNPWKHFGDHKMSRNVIQAMDKIFDKLKSNVSDDDRYLINSTKRHVIAEGDEEPVIEFVKRARMKGVIRNEVKIGLFDFEHKRYLLVPERFGNALFEIGFSIIEDLAIEQGTGMLAIGDGLLSLDRGVTSLGIIEKCLGVLPDPGEGEIGFRFNSIRSLFEGYSVFEADDSIFELCYEEDFDRLLCYICVDNTEVFSDDAKIRLKQLSLLRSSRSISSSLLNSFHSSLVEYSYLQLYQCIEYLFRLENCFLIADENGISSEVAINIVVKHEFKVSEQDNLFKVIKQHAPETAVDGLISVIDDESSPSDKWRSSSKYLYRLRCSIAHLRYNQDEIRNINWSKCIEAIVDIIYGIYNKRDKDIVELCNKSGAWNIISELTCK